jgi:hypothetical protein
MKIRILICLLILTLSPGLLYAFGFGAGRRLERESVPEVRLISPVTDEIDLTGKTTLEFKWSPHEGDATQREYYDFRLYKGYDMLESTLILKKKLYNNESGMVLPAEMFETGQVYTWSMKQAYSGIQKSHRSYSSFKALRR